MVSCDIDASYWRRQQFGPCVAMLGLQLEGLEITIINVYKPQEEGFNGQALSAIKEALCHKSSQSAWKVSVDCLFIIMIQS